MTTSCVMKDAETTAALALVDPQAGTIDGAGGWPT
jgi:hypothetical protein